MALLINNLAPDAVPVKQLAPAIMEAANKHHIDPLLLARIVVVESRGRATAVNKRSKDYGIAQVNIYTARSMGVPMSCLMDYKCNLDTAAALLHSFKRLRGNRPCLFNLGPKGRFETHARICFTYEQKLASIK